MRQHKFSLMISAFHPRKLGFVLWLSLKESVHKHDTNCKYHLQQRHGRCLTALLLPTASAYTYRLTYQITEQKDLCLLFTYNIRAQQVMVYIPQLDANRRKDDTEANGTLTEHMSAHMGPTAKISSFPSAPMQNVIQRLLGLAINFNQLCTVLGALARNIVITLAPIQQSP